MQLISLLPFLATTVTLATAAPAPAPKYPQNFFVTDFTSPCTKSIPPQCSFHFNVTVDNVPGNPKRSCNFNDTETDYVLCGFGIPEQTFSAYVVKPANGDSRFGNLRVKYSDMLTANPGYVVFGNKTLTPNIPKSFSFPVVARTQYA